MVSAAVLILAGTESHAELGRLVNGLEAAREFHETEGDELELVFDGAGTQWIPELEDPDHDYHDLYTALRGDVSVCDYCTAAFDVEDAVDEAPVDRVDENDGHPSVRSLVADGYTVMTF